MSDARAQAEVPTTKWPAEMERPHRRLSDKVRDAIQQALAQGRHEIADCLTLVHQAINEQDEALLVQRRHEDLGRE